MLQLLQTSEMLPLFMMNVNNATQKGDFIPLHAITSSPKQPYSLR